jgi:hypothetical protein
MRSWHAPRAHRPTPTPPKPPTLEPTHCAFCGETFTDQRRHAVAGCHAGCYKKLRYLRRNEPC